VGIQYAASHPGASRFRTPSPSLSFQREKAGFGGYSSDCCLSGTCFSGILGLRKYRSSPRVCVLCFNDLLSFTGLWIYVDCLSTLNFEGLNCGLQICSLVPVIWHFTFEVWSPNLYCGPCETEVQSSCVELGEGNLVIPDKAHVWPHRFSYNHNRATCCQLTELVSATSDVIPHKFQLIIVSSKAASLADPEFIS
jgi:hypothetical protein